MMNSIAIDQEKCNQDGICVAECPARIIQLDSKKDDPTASPDFDDSCLKYGHCVTVSS
jgi:ferredoxin